MHHMNPWSNGNALHSQPVDGSSIPGRPITGRAVRPPVFAESDPRSNPPEHKLLTPPPPPKSDIQFQGIEASESKNPLGDRFIGQNDDFTRGWTSNIMPLGMLSPPKGIYVVYPPKGGVYDVRACA